MNVYERIVELLKEETLLKDFKYVKSNFTFVRKVDGNSYLLILEHFFRSNVLLTVRPMFSVRFEILHKWYEKFSFKTLRDQRNNDSSGAICWPARLGLENSYTFSCDEEDFDEVYPMLLYTIKSLIEDVMPKFLNLKDYYERVVSPILVRKELMPGNGADWIFEYLAAARIVAPEKYDDLKAIIMNHVKLMVARGEPNVIEYEGKWDEIFAYLESLDFSSGKAREQKQTEKNPRRSRKKDLQQ